MYKNLIWDFDGILFDSYPEIAGAFSLPYMTMAGPAIY
jgi:phosphoglycolate phosphatase-like HAD superfamily hydrolase